MSRKVSIIVLITLSLIVASMVIVPINEAQTLPSLTSSAKFIPFSDLGPTAPVIVGSNECFTANLLEDFDIKGAFMLQIKEIDQSLMIYNYSLTIKSVDYGKIEICLPSNVEDGLYDLELLGDTVYVAPRSVWVITNIPRVIRIVAMSDLHFGTGPDITYNGDLSRYTAAILANSLNATLIIWTGDITESGAEAQTQLTQVYRYMMLYKYPVFSVAGNHDYPGGYYRRYLGPTRWVRVLGDQLLIIGIYTTPYESERNIITWDEIQFLEEALVNYSYIPYKIIAFHYPMFYYQGELTTRYDDEELLAPYAPNVTTPVSSYWSGNMSAFRYVLKLIEDYGVNIVLAGHIHVDQYVKYTSTRTNTTTYFITMTTAAHGTSTYQGITCFELDLETGEISFPLKPPSFIGFENSTNRFSRNSIPLIYFPSKLIKTPFSYKLTTSNQITWYDINISTIIALPWSTEFVNLKIVTNTTSTQAESRVVATKLIRNTLFTYIRLYNPPRSDSTIIIASVDDRTPPAITLRRYLPEIPVLNRTFTMLIEIQDNEWGLDFDNVILRSNITDIKTRFSPETITLDLNKITLTVSTTVIGSEHMVVYLEVLAIDNHGYTSSKKYIITFYPPGVTPTEPAVKEFTEEPPSSQTSTETITSSITPTDTLTPTTTSTTLPETTGVTSEPQETGIQSIIQGVAIAVITLVIIVLILLIKFEIISRRKT
ncbi:MAG: metallophosphoesterase [Desulfurococcaceae archaeon]